MATDATREQDLYRIEEALERAAEVLERYSPGRVAAVDKGGGDPLTRADLELDALLRRLLPAAGEGWLSEETADDRDRLGRRRVWVVDPLDGTREFVAGIPEWCVSIGLVEDGRAVAGGIVNPAAGRRIVGSLETGVTLNGEPAAVAAAATLDGARLLASRSEVRRGEWRRFQGAPFEVVATGSVAYKLGLVAAGLATATWTLVPKHEWDVAAGVALVTAAGGAARTLDGAEPRFNRPLPRFSGLIAAPAAVLAEVAGLLALALPEADVVPGSA